MQTFARSVVLPRKCRDRLDGGLAPLHRSSRGCTYPKILAQLDDYSRTGVPGAVREQLLPWSECEPQVADYCQAVELPATAAGFVKHLQEELSTTAKRVDAALPSSGHVVINDKGEPVIKRGLRRQPSASAQALEAGLPERMPSPTSSTCWPTLPTGPLGRVISV